MNDFGLLRSCHVETVKSAKPTCRIVASFNKLSICSVVGHAVHCGVAVDRELFAVSIKLSSVPRSILYKDCKGLRRCSFFVLYSVVYYRICRVCMAKRST